MDKVHLDTLTKNWTYLVENLQVREGLMDHLIEGGAISVDMVEAVTAEKGRREQVRVFLTRFTKCGPGAFDCLIHSLEQTQPFIAEQLSRTVRELQSQKGNNLLCK